MAEIVIQAQHRQETGKEAAKRLRNLGMVPSIVYKSGEIGTNLSVKSVDLIHALHTAAGENVIIQLEYDEDGKKQKKTVIIKEMQHHPIKGDIIHVDFSEISLKQKIQVKIPIHPVGEAIGVKRDGGILEHVLWELDVECLPTKIPEKVDVKVDELEIGDSIHVKDIQLESDIEVLTDPEEVVIIVEHPKKEEEPVAEEELPEGTEQEPEVIGEKEREERQKDKEEAKQQEEKQEDSE
jgi:large subunit ribosomal protein L25